MPYRVLYLVDHPIQYQAPLLRRLASQPDIDLKVVFKSLSGAERYMNRGFRRQLSWDVSLLDGYDHDIAPNDRQLAAHISRCDAVWLHGWQGRRMRRALGAAYKSDRPILMRGENTLFAVPKRGLRRIVKRRYLDWILLRCAAFLCIGSANRDYYLAQGVEPERLYFMPYAVDNDYFRAQTKKAAERRREFRAELGLEPGRPVVLFAGKLQPRKNPALLLKAFRSIDRPGLRNPYLLFVGDGVLRGSLERAAARDRDVRVLGFRNQSELPAFYDLADVFVLPSRREPWGLAVNEAMNARCAIIASDECGCAPDLVYPDCGSVVPAGKLKPLAGALATVLSDPDRCRSMGERAYDRIGEWNFDRDVGGFRAALAAIS